MKIAEDLKENYKLFNCPRWKNIFVCELIERTSQAEVERDEAREKLNRLNFDRTDNASPFTRACHLLQDGFISVGKALEWWRVYVNTGNLEPIRRWRRRKHLG